jgi:hypothetical protein
VPGSRCVLAVMLDDSLARPFIWGMS